MNIYIYICIDRKVDGWMDGFDRDTQEKKKKRERASTTFWSMLFALPSMNHNFRSPILAAAALV